MTQPSTLSTMHYQRGITLIELLVSLALGMILLLGVVQVYVSSKKTYIVQNSLSEMQENARFAVGLVFKDLRLAGYLGCGNLSRITPLVPTGLANYVDDSVVTAFENTGGSNWSPSLPSEIETGTGVNGVVPAPDSDVLSVMSTGACSSSLTSDMASTTADISIDAGNSCDLSSNTVALISDCSSADVFEVTSVSGAGGIAHDALNKAYTTEAEVLKIRSVSYFVAVDPDSQIPSLYVFDNNRARAADNPIALVEGVESLQLQFGTDTSGDGVPDTFETAEVVTGWENVVSARLTMLMRSAGNVGADPFTDDEGVNYNDGVLRKSFVSNVQLRNRG